MNGTGVNNPVYRSGSSAAAANFNPVVSFNGTSQYFNLPGGFSNFTAGTSFFGVLNPGAGTVTNWGRVLHLANTDNANGLTFNRSSTTSDIGMHIFTIGSNSPIGNLYTTSGPFSSANGFNIYQWNIAGGTSEQTGRAGSILVNGVLSASNTGVAVPTNITRTSNRVGFGNGAEYINGYIPELILYNRTLTPTENQRIQTYLAIKYGRTLGSPSSPVDYVSTAGSTVWTGNATYQYNVMGIGRDDASALHQRIAASQDVTKDIITVSSDNNFTGDNTTHTAIAADQSFLLFGHNGSSATALQQTNLPGSFCGNRLQRAWRVQKTNNAGAVNLQFNIGTTLGSALSASQIILFIDEDGDGNFATGSQRTVYASGYSGGIATFAGLNFDTDNTGADVFTLATQRYTPVLVALSNTSSPTNNCADGSYIHYINPDNVTQSVIAINPNGNSFAASSVQIVNSNSLTATNVTNSGSYYQQTTGGNAIRIANRFTSIVAPGTYAANGGVIVRIYYTDADTISMLTDAFPGGAAAGNKGWYKSSRSSAADVVSDMQDAGLSSAETVTPIAYGIDNGVRYAEFRVTDFSTFGYYARTSLSTLPVKLEYFKAKSAGCAVVLNWEAATEEDASGYSVEYSTNSAQFVSVGEVKVHGANQPYQFVHTPTTTRSFYRLKMVDRNGSFAYSAVVSINLDCAAQNQFRVTPSPAHNEIVLTGPKSHIKQIVLLDATGKVVQRLPLQLNGSIDVSKLSPGIYLIQITQTNQQRQTLRFLKQ